MDVREREREREKVRLGVHMLEYEKK